ncbi:MAG: type VI secretion system TssO [Patiriisocius sp.]|uniref:type VI secretion system TssO n=1 Tax=Patiriisocius sp. TaxID=2822396 RepID=UPI003EF64BF3
MKPKNSKDRRSAFLKFLGLFIVTVGMIVAAVYFNFKVPNKENDLLRAQSKFINEETAFQNNFYTEMEKVKSMIDSLDVPGAQVDYESKLISSKLVDMQKSLPTKDSTYLYDMHSSIVQMYVELMDNKQKLRSLSDAEGTIQEYKEAYESCRQDLKQAERELRIK